MRHRLFIVVSAILALGAGATAVGRYVRSAHVLHPVSGKPISVPGRDGDGTLLFNGWRISPAGRHVPTGDMLLGGAISPDGATLAIANCGYGANAVHFIDLATEKEIARVPVPRAWNGIAWAPDGKRVYVAGGIENTAGDVLIIERKESGWARAGGLKLTGNNAQKTATSGLALSPDGTALYVLNVWDGCLYVLDTASSQTLARLELGDHPISCRLAADGKTLYAALWGGSELVAVDVRTPASPAISAHLATGNHPNDIAIGKDGRLFVSCANSDEVTVLDGGKVTEHVKTALTPKAPPGSTPYAVALSPDERFLYAANADNNDVAVIDISSRGHSKVAGFLPTGWYPSAVTVTPDGKRVIVCSGKGTGSRANPAKQPISPSYATGFEYIGRQLGGMVSFVDATWAGEILPAGAGSINVENYRLPIYTSQVIKNSPYRDAQLGRLASARKSAVPARVGDPSPIKYVLFIIKENRTYDQVFGDMGKGNGDPNLTLFGRDVTPNAHALADQFVLLDNLYCSGEVSADGHPWSTAALATDYTQRNWVLSYSGKGNLPASDRISVSQGGFLWEACGRKGLSYRSYGEQVHATSAEAAPEQSVAGARGLKGHGSARYVGAGWNSSQPMRDTDKADVFIEEFKEFERTGTIPRFTVMSLGENHTRGATPGWFTPKACVASNDQALGKIVDAISHSSAWKEFAIFVIEDDAQNGPDHVDSHRTAGLVISPYTRRRAVDSTMYSTCSMLRTMELILGVPPLTQYDASATPMFESFTDRPDLTPFTLAAPRISLDERNKATAYGAAESKRMDFSDFDQVDEQALNRILWHNVKGASSPMPAPVRRSLTR